MVLKYVQKDLLKLMKKLKLKSWPKRDQICQLELLLILLTGVIDMEIFFKQVDAPIKLQIVLERTKLKNTWQRKLKKTKLKKDLEH